MSGRGQHFLHAGETVMAATNITWPKKAREFHNHHFDSTIWNDFQFRDDDIIIATYAKSGTTWVQQIIAQLLFNGAADLDVADMSPWLDLRIPPKDIKLAAVQAQTHRRFLKTHLPVDALVFSPRAKYLYIGRDGRDVVWSLYNHHATANAEWYKALNDTPGRVGPPIEPPPTSIREYYQDWFEKEGYPFWPFWENVKSWWDIRHLPNVALVHFAQLKADMPGQIRRMAAFLDSPIDESQWAAILEHCSFEYMKEHATQSVPLGGAF
jgi:aryl sulfotransferase